MPKKKWEMSWAGCTTTGEAGPCAFWLRNAERPDAVDGVRRQFSRARPGLGLCRAQLSEIRGGSVLDRFGIYGGCRRGAGDAAHVRGFAAAAVGRRHHPDIRRLPCRDGGQAVLRPAGLLARHRADIGTKLRRTDVLPRRLRQHGDADTDLFAGPVSAVRVDTKTVAVAAAWP